MAMSKAPKYTHQFVDRSGKARFYFRRFGKRVALPGLPWSPEFMEAYEIALHADPSAQPKPSSKARSQTFNALAASYFGSEEFSDLAPETRSARRRLIEKFRAQHGDKRVAHLRKDHVETMLASIPKRHAKRNWFKAIRGMLKLAVKLNMRGDNPTDSIKLGKLPKSGGFHTWTNDEIRRYRDFWPLGTQQRLTMELALEMTMRRADVTKYGPQHEDRETGTLAFRHTKNGSDVVIPITPELRAAIDACPTTHLTYLYTRGGAPRSAKALGGDFRRWCDLAGLPKFCSLHGLRKGGARRLAEASATPHEIMAVTGHKTLSEVERYTREVDHKKLARSAMKKKLGAEHERQSGKLEPQFANSAEKQFKIKVRN